MSKAWVYQDHRQRSKPEKDRLWSVGWLDPDGRRRSKQVGSKSLATKFARKIEGELCAGIYQDKPKVTWAKFRQELGELYLEPMKPGTREQAEIALRHFERLVRPQRLDAITTQVIDAYKKRRMSERGARPGSTVSFATINRELRTIGAALRKAVEWELLAKLPKIKPLKEPGKEIRFVTPEHFEAMYAACEHARFPDEFEFESAEWWRALLTFAYMTGWRISEILALRREDVVDGFAVTRAADNKGGRTERVPLHPVVLEHLEELKSFERLMLPWHGSTRALYAEFGRIQRRAGIHLPCYGDHVHTPACHVYGFHDLRRAFATQNAGCLPADVLQRFMRHRNYQTTQLYVNMARRVDEAVASLKVPEVLRAAN